MRINVRFATIVLVSIAVVGCDILTGDQQSAVQDRIRERIEARRAQWESQDIVDYKLTYSQQVGGTPVDSVNVYVRGGVVDSVATFPAISEDALLVETVNSFFDLIAARVGEEGTEYDASFNQEKGYPTRYSATLNDGTSQSVRTISLRQLDVSGK